MLRPLCYHEPSELNFGEGVEGTISNISEVKVDECLEIQILIKDSGFRRVPLLRDR